MRKAKHGRLTNKNEDEVFVDSVRLKIENDRFKMVRLVDLYEDDFQPLFPTLPQSSFIE